MIKKGNEKREQSNKLIIKSLFSFLAWVGNQMEQD